MLKIYTTHSVFSNIFRLSAVLGVLGLYPESDEFTSSSKLVSDLPFVYSSVNQYFILIKKNIFIDTYFIQLFIIAGKIYK